MFRRSKSNQRRDVKKRRGFQPGLETLEDRMVPSTFRPPPTILTGVDMSTMATIVGGYYSGPAHLYLNFDGASEGSAVALSEQTIQQTLYRLSEIYAPFNVEVSRLYGPGYYDTSRDGSTTIFIGKSPEGDTYTPDENSDYPHLGIGYWHRPNSDGNDLAYVYPGGVNTDTTAADISRGAAHEAGHTFGLTHVRTDKNYTLVSGKLVPSGPFLQDPAPLPTGAQPATATTPAVPASTNQGTVSDVMSYTDGHGQYFAKTSLPITNYNFDGSTTSIDGSKQPFYMDNSFDPTLEIMPSTQNSFAYLQTVFGSRPAEAGFRVANADTVDPSKLPLYRPQRADTLPQTIYITHSGTIGRLGDYDVSRWTAPRTETLAVTAQATGTSSLKPLLLVYDDSGNLVMFNDSAVHQSSFAVKEGAHYYFVVGAEDGNSTGTYKLDIQEVRPLFVTINSISDPAHVDPTHGGLTDSAQVQIGGTDATLWADNIYYQVTALRGEAHIEIDVTRTWHGKHIDPTLILKKGEWYFDLHDGKGLQDTGMSSIYSKDEVKTELGLDKLVSYGAPSTERWGQVWKIDLTYDVTGGTIKGTAHGPDVSLPFSGKPGKSVSVPVSGMPDTPITVSGFGLPEITFTISMDSPVSSTPYPTSKSWHVPSWYKPSGPMPLLSDPMPPSLAPSQPALVSSLAPSVPGSTRTRDALFAMAAIGDESASSKWPTTSARKPLNTSSSAHDALFSQADMFDIGLDVLVQHTRYA